MSGTAGVLHVAAALVLWASLASAATVTLQQGLDGYSGCTTAMHWGKPIRGQADP